MSRRFVVPSAVSSWSLQEVKQLRSMVEAGTSIRDMSLNLRRSESAIRNKAAFHGIPLRGLPYATGST